MAFQIGKHKCYFCEDKHGFFHSVHDYGVYGDVGKRIYYHPECLEMVETEPEKFGSVMMDKAIFINERKLENIKKTNSSIVENHRKKVDELHRMNFERMMPKRT